VTLLELGVPFCFSVFSGARLLLGLGMLFRVMAGHWLVAWAVYSFAETHSSLMLGHHLDASASHLMRCTSYVMPCASCLMLGHRLDACASCVELGAPWVTEASSFAVFFIFFQSLAL